MTRPCFAFALLCACSAGPTTPTAVQESQESQGAEGERAEGELRHPMTQFSDAVEAQIYTFEAFDEHQRWQRQEADRRAESDEPPLPDPDELAQQFDVFVSATRTWEDPPWPSATASIQAAIAALGAGGDRTARARAAANQMEQTLREAVAQGVVDRASCWLGMRLISLDAERLDTALLQESTAAALRRQASYATDEGEGAAEDEEHETFMDELDEAMERSEGIVERGRELLSDPANLETFMVGAPESFDTVMAELQSLQQIVTPYLSERVVADFETQREALRMVCRP